MNTKHTPGPWEIRPSSNPKNGTAWRDIVSTGCEFSPSYVGESLEQDARLIAAAPDLLAALEAFVARAKQLNGIDTGPVAQASAAIAKATGNG